MRVQVQPLHERFKSLRLRSAKIADHIRRELERSGLRIVTDKHAPRCTVRIIGNEDARFPNAISLATLIEIEQRARVHRVEQDLAIATSIFVDVRLTPKNETWKTVRESITLCVAYLANSIRTVAQGE